MTRSHIFRSIFGILGAAVLTMSLGACMSGGDSMNKSTDSTMSKSMDDTTKKDTMNDSTMSDSSSTTMSGSSTMGK